MTKAPPDWGTASLPLRAPLWGVPEDCFACVGGKHSWVGEAMLTCGDCHERHLGAQAAFLSGPGERS